MAIRDDMTQIKQRMLGTKNVRVVQNAWATIATAACGVASSVVLACEKPKPEMINGLKLVIPALVIDCAMTNIISM
jgi:hypothetical protein